MCRVVSVHRVEESQHMSAMMGTVFLFSMGTQGHNS